MRTWLALLALLVCVPSAHAQNPPGPLLCMARHYGLATAYEQNAWKLVLPSGVRLPYDDGVAKDFDETLASPDVQDTLAVRYSTGPLQPVTRVDEDPGRVRLDRLLDEIYGQGKDLVNVRFLGQKVRVHKRVEAPLRHVELTLQHELTREPALRKYLQPLGGGYNARRIAGSERTSAHAYGIALDLNPRFGNYWRWDTPANRHWRNQLPAAVVSAFEAAGFVWGGRWYHYDTLHFEYRPELLDAECWPTQ